MSIIGKVERRNWKVRLLNLTIHTVLILGAATMVYPLLLMISGSVKSDVDFSDFSLFPEYVYNDTLLYRKHLSTKYNGLTTLVFDNFREPLGALSALPPPDRVRPERVKVFREFLTQLRAASPHYRRGIGSAFETGVYPVMMRSYREHLIAKYGKGLPGLRRLNELRGTDYTSWGEVALPTENFQYTKAPTDYSGGLLAEILEFKDRAVPELHTYWFDPEGAFIGSLRKNVSPDLDKVNAALNAAWVSWAEIDLPERWPADRPALAALWLKFVREDVNLAFLALDPAAAPDWQRFLAQKYGPVADLNAVYHTDYASYDLLPLPETLPPAGQLRTDWNEFLLAAAAPRHLIVRTLAHDYRVFLEQRFGTPEVYDRAIGSGFRAFSEVPLPAEQPRDNLALIADWTAFTAQLPPEELGLTRQSAIDYRAFVEERYHADFERLSADFGRRITDRGGIAFPARCPAAAAGIARQLFTEFALAPGNEKYRQLPDPEKVRERWNAFLSQRYDGDLAKLNGAYGETHATFRTVSPPLAEYEWTLMLEHRGELIGEYLKRNYLMVMDTIITNGNAAKNTLIYCFLAVLTALIVNPLCAYGLSRFKMASSYKILLFLMLPMAFPAMVLGIPQFLLIKNLGLLNTFAALILPGMANGYSIFLLKGFFDSLPKELFESAALDGASEWTVFWHIAMSLSTPILSVIALGAFTGAYANFMMAFLICQDQSMWTMMVHLYQLQQRSSQAVGFASLIIAAVPTLLVFIFCQNIIIKGIVVPSEK